MRLLRQREVAGAGSAAAEGVAEQVDPAEAACASPQNGNRDRLRPCACVQQRGRENVIVCRQRTRAVTWTGPLYLCRRARVRQRGRGDVVLCAGSLRQRGSRHV